MLEIQEILQDLGYNLRHDGNGWRSSSVYRQGNNPTSLKIFQDGSFIDFVTRETGDFTKLVGLTTGDAKSYLEGKTFEILKVAPKITQSSSFELDYLKLLEPDYSYPISRGISEETLKSFSCGIVSKGKLANRFVFPVFNEEKDKILGFNGRALFQTDMKWKILGQKKNFLFPNGLSGPTVIVVESIFDCLSLWECGIQNSFVSFGLTLSKEQVMFLLRKGIQNIVISLNNDGDFGRGNVAADSMKQKLGQYFDKSRIKVVLPEKNDWNEQLMIDGKDSVRKKI